MIELQMTRRALLAAVGAFALATAAGTAVAADAKLKIGFVGVTSGPAAAWGTSNVRSMQTRAAWLNEQGGVKIGDKTYEIEIVTFDDQKDPKRAVEGMEKMAQEGIHYVVGPNVDDGAAAVRPVAELLCECQDVVLGRPDKGAARLDHAACGKLVVEQPPAHPAARLHDEHGSTRPGDLTGGDQAGQARADHDHVDLAWQGALQGGGAHALIEGLEAAEGECAEAGEGGALEEGPAVDGEGHRSS